MRAGALTLVGLLGCVAPIDRARNALDEGEVELAVEILEGITREHASEPGAWLALGRARMAASRPVAAREAFERAAQLLPTRSAPRILVGHTYELERRYDEAELAYAQACAVAPTEARPERVLGVRLLRWGRAREAIVHLERAVMLDPASAATWNALAVAQFHAGDGGAALDTFARAAQTREASGLAPDRDLAIGQAALLVRSRRFEEALALYDQVVAREPRFAPAHVGRALVLHELGRCAEARAAFERSVEAAGDTLEARARALEYERGPGARCVERAR
jgi:tetratricopeptide (TPR) repeat protein